MSAMSCWKAGRELFGPATARVGASLAALGSIAVRYRSTEGEGMSKRARLWLVLAPLAVACMASGAALAKKSGYSISKITVPKTMKRRSIDAVQGKGFTLKVQGTSKKKSLLSVYLDHRKCDATDAKEGNRDAGYQPGYSFFIGPSSSTGAEVQGSFSKSFTAHPGGKTGRHYVCAYLTAGQNGQDTRAFLSATYEVTK